MLNDMSLNLIQKNNSEIIHKIHLIVILICSLFALAACIECHVHNMS